MRLGRRECLVWKAGRQAGRQPETPCGAPRDSLWSTQAGELVSRAAPSALASGEDRAVSAHLDPRCRMPLPGQHWAQGGSSGTSVELAVSQLQLH